MRTFVVIAAVAAVCVLTALGATTGSSKDSAVDAGGPAPARPCRRIVSLAPSLTETLFALGLGDNVVGVTRFCNHPREAKNKPEIGGYADPNYEAILAAEPDVVFLLDLHEVAEEKLGRLEVRTHAVETSSVADILAAIDSIGAVCGRGNEAEQLRSRIEDELARVSSNVPEEGRPRVLLAVGGNLGPDGGEVFAAGPGTYLDEVLKLAGGRNVLKETPVAYPRLSTESILNLRPDVILDLSAEHSGKAQRDAMARWEKLAATPAVENDRVYLVDRDDATVPGPRVGDLAEHFAEILNRAAAETMSAR